MFKIGVTRFEFKSVPFTSVPIKKQQKVEVNRKNNTNPDVSPKIPQRKWPPGVTPKISSVLIYVP